MKLTRKQWWNRKRLWSRKELMQYSLIISVPFVGWAVIFIVYVMSFVEHQRDSEDTAWKVE